MNSTLMLTGANIRKNKGQAVSLLVLVLMTVMFLNIGLVLYINGYSPQFVKKISLRILLDIISLLC